MRWRVDSCDNCGRESPWMQSTIYYCQCGRVHYPLVDRGRRVVSARPVRVGDMVIVDRDKACRHQVMAVTSCGCMLMGRDWSPDDTFSRLQHADGAPIDVEATLAELRKKPEPAVIENRPGRLAALADNVDAEFKAAGEAYERFVTETAAGLLQSAQLVTAQKRIAELEASLAHARECTADRQTWVEKSERDRNRLSDEAGALRTELRDVKAELADALRKIERLERKAGKR